MVVSAGTPRPDDAGQEPAAPSTAQPEAEVADAGSTEIVLRLVGTRVAGSVRDEDTRRLVGGRVRILVQVRAGGPWRLARTLTTDGRFNVRLDDAPYRVRVVYVGRGRHHGSQATSRR